MLLDTTTRRVTVKSNAGATTAEPVAVADYSDLLGADDDADLGGNPVTLNGATRVALVPAPADASDRRRIRELSIFNADSVAHTITVEYDDNGTYRTLYQATVQAGAALVYVEGAGWLQPGSSGAVGIPSGGLTGQVLAKISGTSYDVSWQGLQALLSSAVLIGQRTLATDADFTLTAGTDAPEQKHTGTLTANRAITLATSGAFAGARFRVTRTGAGAFNLSLGGLKNLATSTWAEAVYDGAAWYLAAYGAL